jgi:hypothetical protein
MTANPPNTTALKTPTQPSISVDLEAFEPLTISRPALAVAVTGVERGTTYTIPFEVNVLYAGVVVVTSVSVVVPSAKLSDVTVLS